MCIRVKSLIWLAILPTIGNAETIRVYNWSEYIDLDLISEFTEITGIDVIYDTYDNSEAVESTLVAGGSGYDVVIVSSEYLDRLSGHGALAQFDYGRLSSFKTMWGDVMELAQTLDKSQSHALPYLWGTTGLGYDRNKILAIMPDAPLDSWDLLFVPEIVSQFTPCGVALTDAIEELTAIGLAYLGHDPNSKEPKELEEVYAMIDAIMPYVTEIGTEQYDIMARGEACVALVWSGDAILANEDADDGVEITYVVPKEGAPLWIDMFVIPSDTQNLNAAHVFIDFIQRPENIARVTNFAFYANANSASLPFINPEILDNVSIYPDEETLERLFPVFSRSAEEKRELARTWRQLQLSF